MYNSIYPISINYTKHNQYRNNTGQASNAQVSVDENGANKQNNTFPNGTKVAIDYTKGQINISQVLTDFRSTILAINAPSEVKEEVDVYLNLVDKESKKENPSRDIILGNLRNASKVSDNFIATALKKPSNVVEKWIETLFLQKINLKADPNEINPDFQLEFPKKAQERIESNTPTSQPQVEQETQQSQTFGQELVMQNVQESPALQNVASELKIADTQVDEKPDVYNLEVDSEFELTTTQENEHNLSESDELVQVPLHSAKSDIKTLFSPKCEADVKARTLFAQAKNMPQTNKGDIEAINLLNEALGVMAQDSESNQNIRAAIHIERGKIFDNYDYVDYALRDYYEATKADDYNLKAQAFYKSGQIYDEFSEFYPAMDNYLSSVAYSAEANNSDAQSRVLTKIAGLYTKQFDIQNAQQYGTLAIETAQETKNDRLIADTYSTDAQNSQYLGDNDRAIDGYKNALSIFSKTNESYSQMAYNYEQAAIVMRNLGNHSKAAKLQLKANQYYQKAQLQQQQMEAVS